MEPPQYIVGDVGGTIAGWLTHDKAKATRYGDIGQAADALQELGSFAPLFRMTTSTETER